MAGDRILTLEKTAGSPASYYSQRAILNWNDGENPGTRSQANRWEPVNNFHLRWVGKGGSKDLGEHHMVFKGTEGASVVANRV